MVSIYKSYLFPSSFLAQDEHQTADKYSQVNKPKSHSKRKPPAWIYYDTISQSSGGPIAIHLSNLFIYLFLFSYLFSYLFAYFLTS